MTQRRVPTLSWTGVVVRGVSPEPFADNAGHSLTKSPPSSRSSAAMRIDTVGALTAEDACVVGVEDSAPKFKSRSALVASSKTVMAAAPPIAGPATRPVDLSTVRGASGRPLMAPDVRGHDLALAQSYNGLRWNYRLARDGLDPLGPSLQRSA